jgi:hypothetical protein
VALQYVAMGDNQTLGSLRSITSSARTSSDVGTSTPIALAVLRLRIVLNLFARSIGRSAAFADGLTAVPYPCAEAAEMPNRTCKRSAFPEHVRLKPSDTAQTRWEHMSSALLSISAIAPRCRNGRRRFSVLDAVFSVTVL